MVELRLAPEAARQLDLLPLSIRIRVLGVIERLRRWPEVGGAKPLRRELVGCYRIRTGRYRVQFRVTGQTVVVERIGHRDGFYEG